MFYPFPNWNFFFEIWISRQNKNQQKNTHTSRVLKPKLSYRFLPEFLNFHCECSVRVVGYPKVRVWYVLLQIFEHYYYPKPPNNNTLNIHSFPTSNVSLKEMMFGCWPWRSRISISSLQSRLLLSIIWNWKQKEHQSKWKSALEGK